MTNSIAVFTLFFLNSFLAAPVLAAEGGTHYLTVRIYKDQTLYEQTVRVTEGKQSNYVGPVRDKQMIFTTLLMRDRGDAAAPLTLQYQLELSGGRNSTGRSLQVQSELALKPGFTGTLVECGPWTVSLSLDTKKIAKKPAVWKAQGLPNNRLTVDVSVGGKKQRCILVTKFGTQSNVSDNMEDTSIEGTRKYGFIFVPLLTLTKNGTACNMQYQLEQSFYNPLSPLQLQSEETLTPGKKAATSGQNYRVSFLLEGELPGGKSGPGKRAAAGGKEKLSADGYGTVPIIQ